MKNFNGTKKEWVYEAFDEPKFISIHQKGYVVGREGEDLTIAGVWGSVTEEDKANAELIVDAGNTANKCGLMPSELLDENATLKKSLRELLTAINAKGADDFEQEVRLAEILLGINRPINKPVRNK